MAKVFYYKGKNFEIIHLKNRAYYFQKHNHVSNFIIGIVLSGQVKLDVQDQKKIVKANEFFLVKPYQVHSLDLPNEFEMVSICIDKNMIEYFNYIDMVSLISDELFNADISISKSVLGGAINLLFVGEVFHDSDMEEYTSDIFNYPFFTIEQISKLKGYDKFYYIKKFSKKVGLTPHKFMIQYRIRLAQAMIEEGKKASFIAAELEFFDHSHFCKQFKNIMGITPENYFRAVKSI